MLTDHAVKALKSSERSYKRSDGGGLYLMITPSGGKWWRYKFRFAGKEKLLALGTYPEVSLKEARGLRDDAKAQLRAGIDPTHARRAQKLSASSGDSFEVVTREWLEKMAVKWIPATAARIKQRLEADVIPWLGSRPVGQVKATEILAVLNRIQARGAKDTAHRAMQECGQIFRYAVVTGRVENNPVANLRGALEPAPTTHHASITEPKAVGALMRAIDGYKGQFVSRCALKFAPLVFVRPGELRHAQWAEFDFDKAEWRIPAERMKMREQHIVPLSTQAIAVLEELRPRTGTSAYVFPSERSWKRPMSENTVLAALRRMGYQPGEMTGHGFRSMASTLLNENGWNKDAIERQLAHSERDGVRASYNYAEHLPMRREMMQWWADYLDKLRRDNKVVPIHGKAA